MGWRGLSLIDRIRWLRYLLPPFLALWVITYQLVLAQYLEAAYGHGVHYGVEIAFYSLAGPLATWLTLVWVERNIAEKERLARQVQAVEKEKTAVLAEERARIARDLHDGVAQTLYFLALKTDILRQQLAGDISAVSELRSMGQTTRKVIREVRRTIFALTPPDWSQGNFPTTLKRFIAGFAAQVGWETNVTIDPNLTLPAAYEPALFRLVQESLNNVAKHAEAQKITVGLTGQEADRLRLIIHDDGAGFDQGAPQSRGFGLRQMAARAAALGGIFAVESSPGSGTRVTAVFPTKPANEDGHE